MHCTHTHSHSHSYTHAYEKRVCAFERAHTLAMRPNQVRVECTKALYALFMLFIWIVYDVNGFCFCCRVSVCFLHFFMCKCCTFFCCFAVRNRCFFWSVTWCMLFLLQCFIEMSLFLTIENRNDDDGEEKQCTGKKKRNNTREKKMAEKNYEHILHMCIKMLCRCRTTPTV